MKCCICNKNIIGYGNNPAPIMHKMNEKCCDDCDNEVVTPLRVALYFRKYKNEKENE